MQATEEHTNQKYSLNDRPSKRRLAAGPTGRVGFAYQLHDSKDRLLPPGSQDFEERMRCLQEEDPQPLGCKCRNSRCLKLYCICFAARKFCDGCACIDCGNTEENVAEVHKRRHKVNVKNPHAFQDKKNPIVAKGCNCLKSRCLKGYCECYAAARGCMPICCCKDCENAYGVRPGIDDQMLGHRRMPMFNYDGMVESEEEGSDPPPGLCAPQLWPDFDLHPHAHVPHISHTSHAVHAPHALNAAQAVRAARPAASNSSEPPHQDLLNLVAAAEQLERDTGLEIPYADTGDNPRWPPSSAAKKHHREPVASPDGVGAQRANLMQPAFTSTAAAGKRSTTGNPPRRPKAAPLDLPARTGRMAAPQHAQPHGEQTAIRSMHAKLLHRVTHRPHPTSSVPGSVHEDGSPLEEAGLVSPIRCGKGGATPHPVKLVRSPEGLHLTVASAPTSGDRSSDAAAVDESNPGASDVLGLRAAAAAQTGLEMMAAHLSARMRPDGVTTTNSCGRHTSDAPRVSMHATRNEGAAKEGCEDAEELHAMLSFRSAQENNAFGSAQPGNNYFQNVAAVNGPEGGMDINSCTAHAAGPVENEPNSAAGGASAAAEVPKTEHSSPSPQAYEQATRLQDSSTGTKLQALLVTTLPGGGCDEEGLYCSIPVSLPAADGAAAANSHTTLLVPCGKVPEGAKQGQQQVRVQLQSVDLSLKDLELMCKSSQAAQTPHHLGQSDERTQSGIHTGQRQSLNVPASNAMRAGDDASQHSGDNIPWGHVNHAMAPDGPACLQHPGPGEHMHGMLVDGPDDMHSKDLDYQDADKDVRRFRSARLQKRAQREGPLLTQVEFDDAMLTTNKQRRMAADASNAAPRPDVLSGIIGKRVVVPRRSRSALPASQMQPAAIQPPSGQASPQQLQLPSQQPPTIHKPSSHTTNTAAYAGKCPAPKDEEQFAVMGLLSLCKAS